MITTQSLIKDIDKEGTEFIKRCNEQRKAFDKRHRKYCAQAVILTISQLLIAVGSVALFCLTKLHITAMILLGIDLVAAAYFIVHIKRKLVDFMIEFDTMCASQVKSLELMRQEHAKQYEQIHAFQVFYGSAIHRHDIVEPLLKQKLSEFEIGQLILNARDSSNSVDEFSMKIEQIKETYNLKENN